MDRLEERKRKLFALYTDGDDEPKWPTTPELLDWCEVECRTAYALGLERAAEVAQQHYMDMTPDDEPSWLDICGSIAAAIRALKDAPRGGDE